MDARHSLAKCLKFLVAFLALNVPFAVSADVDVASAEIVRIGLIAPDETRGAMVQLRDRGPIPAWSGTRQFFLSQSTLGTEGLAMVLTAFTMGRSIWVRIAGAAEPLSLVTVIYVNAD